MQLIRGKVLATLSLVLMACTNVQAAPVPTAAVSEAAIPATAPQQWLDQMLEATRKLTYRGHFVYQQGSSLETLYVTHTTDKGLEKERIVYLDGVPKQMIRKGKEITFASADRPPTRFQHDSLVPMVGRFTAAGFDSNYKLQPSPEMDRVAGREAVRLSVIPVDRFRYGYQLWLDRESALLLKSVMLDSEGKIIERMQYTNLSLDDSLTKEELAAMDQTRGPLPNETLVKMQGATTKPEQTWGWEAGWIPDGFELQNQSRRVSPVSDRMVDTVIFSDGLASISVFVEPDETRVLSQAVEQIGSMAAVSKVFRNGDAYFHVTVVGEVPLGTAERIAVSVRPEAGEEKAEKQ